MDKAIQEKLLEIVRQNYDEIAGEFDVTRQKRLWPELIKLAAEVKEGDSVLDIGCGNGRSLEAFKNKKISYLGVDASEKLINLAVDNFRHSRYKFLVGDILRLSEVTQDKFDYIFCIAVLHHIPGEDLRSKALEQLKDRLRPGGRIILTAWNLWRKRWPLILRSGLQKIIGRNSMDWGDLLFDWKRGKISQRYYHVFSTYEFKKLVNKAGLSIDKIYHDEHNYYLVLSKQN
jgi:SAM-dependent methyltransferase